MIRGASLGVLAASVALLLGAAMPSQAGVDDDAIASAGFPKLLSDYGFFTDESGLVPNAEVTAYSLNTPLFSDYAEKLRYIYIPAGMQAKADGEGLIDFPVGSALIKSFGYRDGEDLRLIETRVLLHRADGWLALPYVWNADQTEAVLKVAGARVQVSFTDPSGERRNISYAVPNKNQCKECHKLGDDVTLIGPKARNLSPDWLAAMESEGRLDEAPAVAIRLPLWEARADAPVEAVARAYLDVNCAHCHNPAGSASNSGLNLGWDVTDPVALGIGKRPVAAGRGSGGYAFSIDPGHPERSIMVHRMNSLDPGVAMPELGRATVHQEGVTAIEAWVSRLR